MADQESALRRWIRTTSTMLVRRRYLVFGTLAALVAADFTIARRLCPVTWRATAMVSVEPSRLPAGVTPVVPPASKRLDAIVARAGAAEPGGATVALKGEGEKRLLEVAAIGSGRDACAALANSTARRLVEEDRRERVELARLSVEAIAAEASGALASLSEASEALDRFQREWGVAGVENETALRARVAEVDARILDDEGQIAELEVEVPILETEEKLRHDRVAEEMGLAKRAAMEAAAKAAAANAPSPAKPASQTEPAPRTPRERSKLEKLEEELQVLLASKTEIHPDVRRVQAEIDKLRAAQAAEQVASEPAPPAPSTAPSTPQAPALREQEPDAPRADPPARRDPTTQPETSPRGLPFGREAAPPRARDRDLLDEPRRDENGREESRDSRPPGARREPPTDVRAAADTNDDRSAAENAKLLLEAPSYAAWRDVAAKLESSRRRLVGVRTRLARHQSDRDRLRTEIVALERVADRKAEHDRLQAARARLAAAAEDAAARKAKVLRTAEIERGEDVTGAVPERLELLVEARAPESPISTPWTLPFLIGLFVAAPLALIVAFVRDAHDRSLHDTTEVVECLGLPVIGVIPHLKRRAT